MMRFVRRSITLLILFFGLAFSVKATEVEVSGLMKDMVVLTIDGNQYVLKKGKSISGVHLLSADARSARLLVDGEEQSYELSEGGIASRAPSSTPASTDKPEVRIYQTDHMYLTTGSINKVPVSLLVDTGASLVAMNANDAKRLGIQYLRGDPMRLSTASDVTTGYRVQLDSIKVGEVVVTGVEAVVMPGNFPQQILLGMSFLNRVEMIRKEDHLLLRKRF